MTPLDDVLRAAIASDRRTLTLPTAFQGLPQTAHGGSVLAAFDALAGARGARQVQGQYRKRVPLAAPLALEVAPDDGGIRCRVLDDTAAVLAEGRVTQAGERRGALAPPAWDGGLPPDHGDLEVCAPPDRPLPVSSSCLACGTQNAAGLQARLQANERLVGCVWRPREAFRATDGGLIPLALTTLLDEAAFWLGALASGESGMTTDLAVALESPLPYGDVTVVGARTAVRQRLDDPRYWDTEVSARDETGRTLARGRITFVAVRGAARRLVAGMLAMNPPDIVRTAFPAYVPSGLRPRGTGA